MNFLKFDLAPGTKTRLTYEIILNFSLQTSKSAQSLSDTSRVGHSCWYSCIDFFLISPVPDLTSSVLEYTYRHPYMVFT